jgi:ubiquinol-cytochrome c reductase subunit 7
MGGWAQDVAVALSRCDKKEQDDRNARLKRAMDLSMKHAYLSKELQVGSLWS